MDAKETIQQLKDDGWKEFPTPFRNDISKTCLAKSFKDHEECSCNNGKHKQVEIYKYGISYGYEGGWEVHVVGELPDEHWVNLQCYSMSVNTTKEVLLEKVEELLNTWDFMVRNNKCYGKEKIEI
jgi:hypothetical protein